MFLVLRRLKIRIFSAQPLFLIHNGIPTFYHWILVSMWLQKIVQNRENEWQIREKFRVLHIFNKFGSQLGLMDRVIS